MKKMLFIAALGLLCLSSCNNKTENREIKDSVKLSIEAELDRIYYADPNYYLDVLSGSDELLSYIELSEDPNATQEEIWAARKALYGRISSDRREAAK